MTGSAVATIVWFSAASSMPMSTPAIAMNVWRRGRR